HRQPLDSRRHPVPAPAAGIARTRAMSTPLWRPSPERIAGTNMTAFRAFVEREYGVKTPDYAGLYAWSIRERDRFWQAIWRYGGVIAENPGERTVIDGDRMPGARWFPDARLNFAENLLRRRDDEPALVFWGEERVKRSLTFAELYREVARFAQALKRDGVKPGDRVAGYMPNMPEAIVAMLGATSIGAIWSSCSPDFGVQGILDRFGQIEPKVLVAADGYYYGGKTVDVLARSREVVDNMPTVERTVVVSYTREAPAVEAVRGGMRYRDYLGGAAPGAIAF